MEFTIKHVIEFSPEAAEILKSLFSKQEITTAGPKTKKAAAAALTVATTDEKYVAGVINIPGTFAEPNTPANSGSATTGIFDGANATEKKILKDAPKEEEDVTMTLEEVRAFVANRTQNGLPGAKVKALLSSFGVAKVTDLLSTDYASFLTHLQGLQ